MGRGAAPANRANSREFREFSEFSESEFLGVPGRDLQTDLSQTR